jgi:proton glutamate symport protein
VKKWPLYLRILAGMVAGVLAGIFFIQFDGGVKFVQDWVKPWGNIFISLLKLMAIPLIFGSIINGITELRDVSKLASMGVKTLLIFVGTTLFSVSIGLLAVNIIKPGKHIIPETRTALLETYGTVAGKTATMADAQKDVGPLRFVENLIPDNIISAAGNNTQMLQVIFFAVLFGIALVLLPLEKRQPLVAFFDSLNHVVLKMIGIVMLGAPIGVFSLMATIIAESPGLDLFAALSWYAVTVIIGLFILIFGFYPGLVALFANKNPLEFLKKIRPVQMLAFGTCSSAATLPLTMKVAQKDLHLSNEASSFVLPVGATVNMDGTCLYQGVAAVFISQAFGLELTLVQQIGIVLTATLASIGSASVPGSGMVMLVIVLAQAGIPEAGLALIIAIDRPLDMLRSVANVSGDLTVTAIISNSLKK